VAGALLGERIFIFGGEAPEGTFNQVESYDPRTNRWSAYAPMPTSRHGLGAAAFNGAIYVIGGGPQPGGSFSNANEALTP
jgi:N-acetylneuraminic acid mutarotase